MNNDQIRLLTLAVIGGCSLMGFGMGSRDGGGVCAIVAVVTLIFFIVKYNKMKP